MKFEDFVQSLSNMCVFGVCSRPSDTPIKYRCPIKRSKIITPAYYDLLFYHFLYIVDRVLANPNKSRLEVIVVETVKVQ